jgi:translation initiation factor 4G
MKPDEGKDDASAAPAMSSAAAKKIAEDVKEFFGIRSLDEAESYFSSLPAEYHAQLVEKLLVASLESKLQDVELVGSLFRRARERGLCSVEALEEGFVPAAEMLDDIAIDAPKAFDLIAVMMRGAGFDQDEGPRARIVGKSMDSERLLRLLTWRCR